jgi:CHRD domain
MLDVPIPEKPRRGMRSMRAAAVAAIAAVSLVRAAAPEEKFHTRLAPVALDATMRASVSGTGAATATLSGNKLTVSGAFQDLKSPATIAHLHLSRVAGVRGPAVFDLTVTHATSGSVSGSIDLTADQVEALRKGRFYIQIHSEKAPDGNLWGWLMR